MTDNTTIRIEDAPIRNPSVEAYGVGNDAVLHDPERNQVFSVTALAKEVWNYCDGATSLRQMGREISSLVDVPLDKTIDRLRQIASDLESQNLLLVPSDDLTGQGEMATMNIIFGDYQVEVRTNTSEFAQATRRLFHEMLGGDSGRETIDVLNVGRSDGQYYVQGTRGRHAEKSSLENAVRTLKHKVSRRFMEARPDLIWLHAGAAARNDTSVLVAGEWGSGKSTVIANLYRAGWKYLSDDRVPYDPDSGQILPFPIPLAYRQPGEEKLSKQDLAGLPKKYLRIESERVKESFSRIDAIVFLTFEPDYPARIEEHCTAEAAVGLACSCLSAGRYHGDAIQKLCELADQVPTFHLQYNSQSPIASLLASAVE